MLHHVRMPRRFDLSPLLARLDGEAADDLETETLDFKSWSSERDRQKSQLADLCEAVICLANQRGGEIVLGVVDRKRTRAEAVQGVGDLDVDAVRSAVYRGTDPAITVDVEEHEDAGRRLLVVHVPRGLSPPHTTSAGVAKIRVGKECRPLTGTLLAQLFVNRGGVDASAQVPDEATLHDLDPEQIVELRRTLDSAQARKADLAQRPDREVLDALNLLHDGRPTIAAILLLGTSSALARFAPTHEVQFLRFQDATRYDIRHNLRGPLLATLAFVQRLLESHLRISLVSGPGMLELSIPDITWTVAREGLLNALMHRDWFLNGPVQIGLHPDRVEIVSPGGFPGDVHADNVLRHAPLRRNPALADALEALGFVNRAGLGVDRMYDELLRMGKAPPRFEDGELSVRLVLPTKTHHEFARFVAKEAHAGRALDLDDLILLRVVTDAGQVDRWSGGRALQAPVEVAASVLARLREHGLLAPVGRGKGTSYRLPPSLSDRLRGREATNVDFPLDEQAVTLRIQAVLAERGRITNAEVRRMTGFSRPAVLRLMNRLREQGLAESTGRGRGAAWVPGPAAPTSGRSPKRRRTPGE